MLAWSRRFVSFDVSHYLIEKSFSFRYFFVSSLILVPVTNDIILSRAWDVSVFLFLLIKVRAKSKVFLLGMFTELKGLFSEIFHVFNILLDDRILFEPVCLYNWLVRGYFVKLLNGEGINSLHL